MKADQPDFARRSREEIVNCERLSDVGLKGPLERDKIVKRSRKRLGSQGESPDHGV